MTREKEYILFCDESVAQGQFFSNFYGGVIVGATQYERVTQRLAAEKNRLNLFGEVKWSKVSAQYLDKYVALMQVFLDEVQQGHLRLRIMFRQNAHEPLGLTAEQIEGSYFRLYYQFVKHAFGLEHIPEGGGDFRLRLYFDEFPETRETVMQFKGFILGLGENQHVRRSRVTITAEDIAEIRSHDHVLAQCLDIVLGAMAFRLNNRHKDKPPGSRRRGRRTVAKEQLYKAILREIHRIRPGLNIGISTGTLAGPSERWTAPYLHWRFIPAQVKYCPERTKRRQKESPTQPT